MSIKIEPMGSAQPINVNASDRTMDNLPKREGATENPPTQVVDIASGKQVENAVSSQTDIAPSLAKVDAADPRMAELERKERVLREQSRKLAAEKQAFDQGRQQQQPKPGAMTADEWKAQFMKNPEALGINRQEMADLYLTQPSEERQMVARLEAKVQELEDRLGEGSKAIEEAQTQAYQNAINQFKAETRRLVASSPGDYELIAANGAFDSVAELIETTYKEDKVLMSVKDAAVAVEEYLLGRALKSTDLKKVREKLLPPQAGAVQPVQQTQAQSKTLNQSMQAAKPMSPRERAIAAFNRKNT